MFLIREERMKHSGDRCLPCYGEQGPFDLELAAKNTGHEYKSQLLHETYVYFNFTYSLSKV